MFSMNKYITANLLEKLDKSAYVHEDIESARKGDDANESSGGEEDDSDDDFE